MKKKTKSEHERDRTEILRYLKEWGFQAITPAMIVQYMDEMYQAISDEGAEFHLRYLAGKGWVEIGEEKILGRPPRILWAKITPGGVDEFDRRTPAESGLRS